MKAGDAKSPRFCAIVRNRRPSRMRAGCGGAGRRGFARANGMKLDRIDRAAVVQHLEVQVGAGGAAGIAHQRDGLALA